MLLEGRNGKDLTRNDSSGDAAIPAAITDTGCERELNEDRYAVIECSSGVAWLVCDGMGGATGGELAAQLAIDAIRRDLEKYNARPVDIALKSALVEANRIIVLRRQNQAFSAMGTTVVAAMFDDAEVVIGNVGDSRTYLVRDGAIQQLTTDHTYVQQLVDRGEIKPEEALAHPQAHILTRCVGAEPGVEIDIKRYWIWESEENEPSDYLVLCSDGLYSLISEGEIAGLVTANNPQNSCVKLVELAKARGGYDNITVAIVPLNGQLRQTAPPGYTAKVKRKFGDDQDEIPANKAEQNSLRQVLILAALAGFAAFATIIGFLAIKFVWG